MKRQIATYIHQSSLMGAFAISKMLLDETPMEIPSITDSDAVYTVCLTDVASLGLSSDHARLHIVFTGEHLPAELTDCNGFYHLRLPIDIMDDQGVERTFDETVQHCRLNVEAAVRSLSCF